MPTTVPVVPDYLGGVFARFKQYQPITDLIGSQLSGSLGKTWKDHTYAILVRDAGALAADTETQRFVALIDVFSYGPTQFGAKLLWRTLHFWLCPDGFTLPNCYNPLPGVRFDEVWHMGGPTYQIEEVTGWQYYVSRYAVRFVAIPVP